MKRRYVLKLERTDILQNINQEAMSIKHDPLLTISVEVNEQDLYVPLTAGEDPDVWSVEHLCKELLALLKKNNKNTNKWDLKKS